MLSDISPRSRSCLGGGWFSPAARGCGNVHLLPKRLRAQRPLHHRERGGKGEGEGAEPDPSLLMVSICGRGSLALEALCRFVASLAAAQGMESPKVNPGPAEAGGIQARCLLPPLPCSCRALRHPDISPRSRAGMSAHPAGGKCPTWGQKSPCEHCSFIPAQVGQSLPPPPASPRIIILGHFDFGLSQKGEIAVLGVKWQH